MVLRPIAVVLLLSALVSESPPLPTDSLPRPLFEGDVLFGLPQQYDPEGIEYSDEIVALGRRLFFDPILSIDRTVSCASCHQPDHGFSSPEALAPGAQGKRTLRSVPTLFNRAFGKHQMWDGKAETLEEQVLLPIENPQEMALPLDRALGRLAKDDGYKQAFENAFDSHVDRDNLARALASFVRRLHFADSPVDRFRIGEVAGLSSQERAGLWLFESKGKCWQCHTGPNFSDEGFHNTGVGVRDDVPEDGRFAITGVESDRGAFKTPTLRALTLTPPYMHDGSLNSLEEVIEFYRRGGNANPHLDGKLRRLDLTDDDARNLLAFLRALSRKAAGKPSPAPGVAH